MRRLVSIALLLAAGAAWAAFPDGWTRKCELVIQSSQVPGALSDVEVTITEDTLPAEIFTRAQSDGGDLRFTADEAGSTLLNLGSDGIIIWDTGTSTAQLHVGLVSSVSAVSDTSIWVWYDTAGTETQPAGSPYRTTAKAVYTLDEDPSGTAPQITDRAESNDLTSNGSMTSGDVIAGVVGNAMAFDGTDDYLLKDDSTANITSTSATTWMWWWRTPDYQGNNQFDRGTWIVSDDYTNHTDGIFAVFGDDTLDSGIAESISVGTSGGNAGDNQGPAVNTWAHEVVTWDQPNDNLDIYLNGSSLYSNSSYTDNSSAQDLAIGRFFSGSQQDFHNGDLDEWRAYDEILSADYIAFRYNNENDPNATIVEGTPEDVGASIAPHVMYYKRMREAA